MINKKVKKDTFVDTLIGSNSKLVGDLKFEGGCHIDGAVVGNLTADPDTESALSISDVGNVNGRITVPYVVLNGKVKGVVTSKRVELSRTARVSGDVYYNLIQIAEGAEINGKLVHYSEGQMPDDKPSAKSQNGSKKEKN
tara:strand:+ start:224 stop:643 length:420 start_codon:yes stop_codon:yes gene_type:complete